MKRDFKWTYLAHLGMKMWGDLPMTEPPKRDGIMTKVLTDDEFDAIWRNPGSNCYGVTENFPDMAEYCHEKIAPERLKGMIMALWIRTIPEYRRLHWQAADLMAEAMRRVSM